MTSKEYEAQKRRERSRRWYNEHRSEKLAYQKRYDAAHREERRKYNREYMAEYRDGIRRRGEATEER